MNIYFFSRHEPDQRMIKEAGGEITDQIKGTISNIERKDEHIIFSEAWYEDDGCRRSQAHAIPADSMVIAVAPLPLISDWLRAIKNDGILLRPVMSREMRNGKAVFTYEWLERIVEIKIVTKKWAGNSEPVELEWDARWSGGKKEAAVLIQRGAFFKEILSEKVFAEHLGHVNGGSEKYRFSPKPDDTVLFLYESGSGKTRTAQELTGEKRFWETWYEAEDELEIESGSLKKAFFG